MRLEVIRVEAAVARLEVKVRVVPMLLLYNVLIYCRPTDVPLPSENRMSIGSLAGIPNGAPAGVGNKSNTWAGANWTGMANANTSAALGKPAPGRDPKSRAKSREYLKQYVVGYFKSWR